MTCSITFDNIEVIVLTAIVEADRQPEAVGQCQAIVDSIARIDRVVLLRQVPGDNGAPVRRYREPDVSRARIDAAF